MLINLGRCLYTSLFLAVGVGMSPVHGEALPPKFSAMDVFDLEWASDPQISPDGKQIVYVRNGMDRMQDRRTTSLWIVDVDGQRHAPLVTGFKGARQPRWSPDGERILFSARADGATQLHALYVERNVVAQLTQVEHSIGGVSWSPDSRHIAFMMRIPDKAVPLAALPKPPEGAKWAKAPILIEHGPFRRDGLGLTKSGSMHAFVLPAEGGTPRQLSREGGSNLAFPGRVGWSPDSTSIYVSMNFNEDSAEFPSNSDIFRYAVDGSEVEQITDRRGPDQHPRASPNGRYLAWLGYDDVGRPVENSELTVLDLKSGERRVVALGIDRDIDDFFWRPNSRGFLVAYDDRGIGKVGTLSLAGQHAEVVDDLGGTALSRPYTGGSFSVSDRGDIAYTRNAALRPAEVGVHAGGDSTTLTALNEDLLANRDLATVEEINLKSSHDGRDIQAWYARPKGAEGPLPTILEIHGGPFAAYGPVFSAEVQLYAAAGYAVLYVNPRGSTSYGEDFANQIAKNYPSEDFDDLMSAVDALVERGVADAEQLFVTGGSGGGILTAWIVGHTDRFQAAVSAKPITNLFSHALTGDAYPFWMRYWFAGPPWEHLETYMRHSPIMYAGEVTTPTLFLTGDADLRTPISESEQMYAALRIEGVDTALVRVPGASHGIAARPSQLIAKVAYVLGWFERYGGPSDTDEE